jgi:hypothetical protein
MPQKINAVSGWANVGFRLVLLEPRSKIRIGGYADSEVMNLLVLTFPCYARGITFRKLDLIIWIYLVFEVKGKVVPVLFLTDHHAMKAYWGSGCIAPRIL